VCRPACDSSPPSSPLPASAACCAAAVSDPPLQHDMQEGVYGCLRSGLRGRVRTCSLMCPREILEPELHGGARDGQRAGGGVKSHLLGISTTSRGWLQNKART